MYQTVSNVDKTKSILLSIIPSVQFIPAALEAVIVLKGLVIEESVPNCVPAKITATGTIKSNPAAKKIGTIMG